MADSSSLPVLIAPTWRAGDDGTDGGTLTWFSPFPVVSRAERDGVLSVSPSSKTDYWQSTFYGFPDPQPHTGPFLFADVEGDFVCEVDRVVAGGLHRYDQAGLMVVVPGGEADPLGTQCWLKTSVEYIPDGPSHLGSVVTNFGFSDWATQDVDAKQQEPTAYSFRIRRLGADYIVEARKVAAEGGEGGPAAAPWSQLRMAHLHGDAGKGGAVRVGLYACSPIEGGFTARFEGFRVRRGRV
jgi:uncharacterized protein